MHQGPHNREARISQISVPCGTLIVAVMRTLAASILMETNVGSTPASWATLVLIWMRLGGSGAGVGSRMSTGVDVGAGVGSRMSTGVDVGDGDGVGDGVGDGIEVQVSHILYFSQ